MPDPSVSKQAKQNLAVNKSEWILTQGSFDRLLAWLDEGVNSEGHSYLETRRSLVKYFDRKNSASPDELADETLNRVARRLEEEGSITSESPAHYCYAVARFVFLESLRQKSDLALLSDNLPAPPDVNNEKIEMQKRSEALEECLEKLDPNEQMLIVSYYQGKRREKIENRRTLARKLELTMNALSIRACRIRDKLEACVQKSLEGFK